MDDTFTAEDFAALGHFVRRWTARHVMRHTSMIGRPESVDARAMLARDSSHEWAVRDDGQRMTPADFVRQELETGASTREIAEHLCGQALL